MLVLTPTTLGSLLAGVALWLMFWYVVNHVDSIPYLNRYLSRKMVLDWIRKNPQTTLLIAEGVNLVLHGIGSASAVFFNLGSRSTLPLSTASFPLGASSVLPQLEMEKAFIR
jgi:hypothetical protein